MLLAEYPTPGRCMHAAEKLRAAGYTKFDAHTPFPVHGLEKAMGLLGLAGAVIAGTLTERLGLINVLNVQGAGYVVAGLLMIALLPRQRTQPMTTPASADTGAGETPPAPVEVPR